MRITINGEERHTEAATLASLIEEQDFEPTVVATALNGDFVPRAERAATPLVDGDSVEVFSPRQGG
ncbi:sulfur carrier protein ThiS [Chthonobacter albigriseus]|uniref:sulfur carrier protein ThiS n=1 Tax=Chthonobacter albigriseus TaxID=1683161 RepID=UPI0015EFB15E|nr:sulfur carrier protein ThiS [Chthonobacter albigriseus]